MPRDGAWGVGMANLAEVAAALGDVARAEPLYAFLEPFATRFLIVGNTACFYGAYAHYLGLLAATMSSWDRAAQHFDDALARVAAIGARPFEAQSQYEYAAMLLARRGPGDREKAGGLLERSLATAGELGLERIAADSRLLMLRL